MIEKLKKHLLPLKGYERTNFLRDLKSYVYVYCEITEDNKRLPIYIGKGNISVHYYLLFSKKTMYIVYFIIYCCFLTVFFHNMLHIIIHHVVVSSSLNNHDDSYCDHNGIPVSLLSHLQLTKNG